MFTKRHGRTHTTLGLLYLLWITMGFIDVLTGAGMVDALLFHALLGSLGICLTLAAAHEFQHKNVKNVASGVLDEHATVTYGEMIEHSFYQGVNLMQILFLHSVRRGHNASLNLLLVFVATSPWLFRDMFPVNRFSDNYTKEDTKSSSLVRFLYRVKKYQYVFYKHFVLHGLNVTVAVYGYQLVQEKPFRLFWLFLNVSYVMDFFLQTLVKKKYLPQQSMLVLQQILMLASSIAAVSVLKRVNMIVALASLVLNFVNRKHDVLNTMVLAVCSMLALR
ncbi:unnamed protein product [Ectocarpus fasciculatus]